MYGSLAVLAHLGSSLRLTQRGCSPTLLQRFSHNGRALHDGMTVDDALIHNLATIHAFVPLCGGGGDGGATGAESRSSYLEMYKDKVADKACYPADAAACSAATGSPLVECSL